MKTRLVTTSSFTLIIGFILIYTSSFGQKQWSLQECVTYALENSIAIKQSQLQVESQQIDLLQSKTNLLPSLNANGSYGLSWGKSVDRFTNQFAQTRTASLNLYLQTEMTVFNGFRLLNTIKQNQLLLAGTKYNLEYAKQMKAMEVTTAYLQVLYAIETLKNKEDQMKSTEIQLNRMQKLVDAGSIALGDLLNIKAQLSSEQNSKVQAENNLQLAYLSLMQLMDYPVDTNFRIIQPNLELSDGFGKILQSQAVYDFAIKNRPEIKSAEINLDASKTGLSIAKSSYYPRLSLSAGLGSGYSGANSIIDGNPIFNGYVPNGDMTSSGDTVYSPSLAYNYITKSLNDQFTDNKNYSVGLNLTIPLFNNLQTVNNVKKAKISIKQAELNLDQEKIELRKTIEQAYSDAINAANTYIAAENLLKARQESFNYASNKFEAGVINAFEFNEAKVNLDAAKGSVTNAKFDYVFRVKVLDFYYGKDLTL